MMTLDSSFYRSSFSQMLREEGHVDGLIEGQVKSLGRVLDRRGIRVTEEQRALYTNCTDTDQLDAWLDRAVLATTAAEVFDVD